MFFILFYVLGWVASSSLQVIKIKRQPPYYFDTVNVPISEGNVLNTYHLDISGFSCNEREDNGLLPALFEFYLEYCADLTQEKIVKPLERFCGQKKQTNPNSDDTLDLRSLSKKRKTDSDYQRTEIRNKLAIFRLFFEHDYAE